MSHSNNKKLQCLLTFALCAVVSLAANATGCRQVVYYHTDALQSPVAASDENGNVIWRESYKPYGERLLKQSEETNSAGSPVESAWDEKLWFTGKQEEYALNLQNFGARWYDQETGRFLSIDPVNPLGVIEGNPESFNRYIYANNNPYLYVDPDGRFIAQAAEVGLIFLAGGTIAYAACGGSGNPWCTAVRGLGDRLIDGMSNLLHNESSEGIDESDVGSEEGCIYCVSGDKTKSGKDYIGSTDDLKQRQKDKSDGRDRSGAEIVDAYPKGDRDTRRAKEQQAMNDRGGVDKLDNKRNEVAPRKWKDKGISPP